MSGSISAATWQSTTHMHPVVRDARQEPTVVRDARQEPTVVRDARSSRANEPVKHIISRGDPSQ